MARLRECPGCCQLAGHLYNGGDEENKDAYKLPSLLHAVRGGDEGAGQRDHGEGLAHKLRFLKEEKILRAVPPGGEGEFTGRARWRLTRYK